MIIAVMSIDGSKFSPNNANTVYSGSIGKPIQSAFATPVKSAVSYVISPVTKGMNNVGTLFLEKAEEVKEFKSLKSENKEFPDTYVTDSDTFYIVGKVLGK